MRLHFGGADPHSLRKNHSTTVPILIGLAAVVGIAAYGCHSNQPNAPQSVSPAAATETSAASVTDAGSATMPPAGAAPAPDPGGASVQTVSSTAGSGANAQSSNSGPVRMVRFVTVQGDVNWRPDDHASWSQAVTNLPVRQGCEISTPGNSRAEVQFDDGSRLQIANGAVVTLTTLYSDADGEYSELTLKDGTICIWPRNEHSVYQVDTPCGSVDATGPGRCRIDASHGVQVADQAGKCAVRDKQGEQTLVAGNYVDLPNDEAPYNVQSLPPHDSFDNWTAQDYAQDQRYQNSATYQDLPRNVAIASDNLDDYGDWRTDPKYGRIWHPHIHEAGWRPYYHGHWVWVDPYGWTWVDNEPWGWAPSHYGTWVDESDGWCWAPGPVNQYWSPAVVDFYET
ncbi:MAG TPA: DUF6600 domain-containing protein, partial [Chthonomonadaceae bacterium]|nr:DUF6600 domain-containing protein [Chthonomonadaceae bacterium]